jgi:GT2 family glycosyltransferase
MDLFTVIPHFGQKALLAGCLESLESLEWKEGRSRIMVIDQDPPKVNRYFTWPVNEGIKWALKEAAGERALVWVLNADTQVLPDTATAALACFEEEGWGKCGMVGQKNLAMDDPDFIFWGGSKQCYPSGRHKSGRVSLGQLTERTEEEWVTFASAIMSTDMIQDVGLLDKTMRHVCSDSDYCFRARAAGWKLFYEPKSVILHKVGSSHHTTNESLKGIMASDQEVFQAKWLSDRLFKQLTEYNTREYLRRR